VRRSLEDKKIIATHNKEVLLGIDQIALRLDLREQITKYGDLYDPLLVVGLDKKGTENNFIAYVVIPIMNGQMAWFELTEKENIDVRNYLMELAEEKPYKSLIERIVNSIFLGR